jgi:anti-sigma B factor antagonist
MHIELRRRDDVLIADLSGRLVLGDAQRTLRDAFDEMLATNWRKIVLNVAGLARIDSSGIGELVACLRTARAAGARLALLQPDDHLRRILHVSQVLPLFPTFENEEDALAALQASEDEAADA